MNTPRPRLLIASSPLACAPYRVYPDTVAAVESAVEGAQPFLGPLMSFAYMPFYTGDYYRDTRHLSMLQHGAYRQLLDHCWDQKGPLPLDMAKCFRICGAVSKEEQDAVVSVIGEFFVKMEDGHYNRRMQIEIERAATLSSARAGAARARWGARNSLREIDAA